MRRILQPELLDSLAPDHPDAQRNRRDLRLTNAIMRNHAWMARTVAQHLRPGETALEVGAGTGELGLALHRRGVAIDGLDLWPRPADWPSGSQWHQADLREFAGWNRYGVILGNLIFHQFADAELGALGQKLGAARVVLACEPTRRRSSQVAYRAIAPLLGANRVTLHDAHVSIEAGFRDQELPRLLGLLSPEWNAVCSTTFIGAFRMIAIRRQ